MGPSFIVLQIYEYLLQKLLPALALKNTCAISKLLYTSVVLFHVKLVFIHEKLKAY